MLFRSGQSRQSRVCTPCIRGGMLAAYTDREPQRPIGDLQNSPWSTPGAQWSTPGAQLNGISESMEPSPPGASNSKKEDVKVELARVYDFLDDFADRLEALHGQDTAVESFSLSPRLKAGSGSWADFDPDKAISRCEACLTALHRVQRSHASPSKSVSRDSDAELQRLRQDLLEAREGIARAERQSQTTLQELEHGLEIVVGKASVLLDVPKPTSESSDPATNCQQFLFALDGLISQLKDSDEIQNKTSISREDSIVSTPSTASSVMVAMKSDTWDSNTDCCTACGKKIGKRNLHRRHHCRACGKCVCSACSPSLVKFSEGELQRVCTLCVSSAFTGEDLRVDPVITGTPSS